MAKRKLATRAKDRAALPVVADPAAHAVAIVDAGEDSTERTLREVRDIAHGDAKTVGIRNKLTALDMMMRHHGLYEQDNHQNAPNIAIHVQLV